MKKIDLFRNLKNHRFWGLLCIIALGILLPPGLSGTTPYQRYSFLEKPIHNSTLSDSGITYGLCGRFGDNLLSSLHALWLSHCYDLPLIYTPFQYASELNLNRLAHRQSRFAKTAFLNQDTPFPISGTNTLFIIPYFSEFSWDPCFQPDDKFAVDWKDTGFRKKAYEMIAPIHPLSLTIPPEGSINIAIHVREGGGLDTEEGKLAFAPKLPPHSFYIDTLSVLLAFFEGFPVHCHFFTDALNPQAVINQIIDNLPNFPSVTFDYRRENNTPNKNVLEDFFSLFHFDILIRPDSNFSLIPSLLHDYMITAYPSKVVVKDKVAQLAEITFLTNEEFYRKKMGRPLEFSLLNRITQQKPWLDFRVAS